MKRNELTVDVMKDRGWYPIDANELRLKDIVFNIQENPEWRYLRCTTVNDEVYTSTEFKMCSTYEVYSHKEYLEHSSDGQNWFKVAFRYVEFNKRCTYAD